MRTPIGLWLLLSLVATPAWAQTPAFPPASSNAMRVDPATQRERDNTRLRILQDELATEMRELATAQNELRDAERSRATSSKVKDTTERIALHRENVAALEREIARVERPADAAIGSAERRQPDNWLIPGQRLTVAGPRPVVLARRRLPLAEPEVKPEWVIRGGFTGARP